MIFFSLPNVQYRKNQPVLCIDLGTVLDLHNFLDHAITLNAAAHRVFLPSKVHRQRNHLHQQLTANSKLVYLHRGVLFPVQEIVEMSPVPPVPPLPPVVIIFPSIASSMMVAWNRRKDIWKDISCHLCLASTAPLGSAPADSDPASSSSSSSPCSPVPPSSTSPVPGRSDG